MAMSDATKPIAAAGAAMRFGVDGRGAREVKAGWPSGASVHLAHHEVVLPDGHRVGYSVGGRGVPLVFLHGIMLNRRVYLRLLGRVAALGFRVFALDAAGHGSTGQMPRGVNSFTHRVDLVSRSLDALGIRSAVVMGHSMGGRMTMELAASRPDAVIAAVLLDAAAGDDFDAMAQRAATWPPSAIVPLLRAMADTEKDRRVVSAADSSHFRRSVTNAAGNSARHPLHAVGTMRAIASALPSRPLLERMRVAEVETIVIHGELDQVVSWASAVSMATHSGGALYQVPGVHHSWMIADPNLGAQVIDQLLRTRLGEAITKAGQRLGIAPGQSASWETAVLERPADS
jgi:pimeloyl-ACP methyl ester carboxylesterase